MGSRELGVKQGGRKKPFSHIHAMTTDIVIPDGGIDFLIVLKF